MKILIFTEGGSDIGLGHIGRCMAIRAAFRELGATTELIVSGDEELSCIAEKNEFVVRDWSREPKQFLPSIERADVVMIDSYLAPSIFYADISRMARLSVYLDDFRRLDYPPGVVVNGAILAEELGYPRRDGVEYLLGARYFPLREEFWGVPAVSVNETVQNIMVTFGAADSAGMTSRILRCLVECAPESRKKVVIGKWFKNIPTIEKAGDRNTDFFRAPDAVAMKEIMLSSDLAISSGGQTLYELARVGLPTIAIAESDNQLNNMRGWNKAGFIHSVDREYTGLPKSVLAGLQQLQSQAARIERNRIGRESVDGKGARRLVDELLTFVRAKKLPS